MLVIPLVGKYEQDYLSYLKYRMEKGVKVPTSVKIFWNLERNEDFRELVRTIIRSNDAPVIESVLFKKQTKCWTIYCSNKSKS